MLKKSVMGVALVLLGAALGSGVLQAQQAPAAGGIKRTILQRVDVPGGTYEVVLGMAEIPANTASIGAHTHFGTEEGTLIEGEAVLRVAGQPDRLMKAGDSYQIPLGIAHDATVGPTGAKLIAAYVVEKGKPFATPAK